jgi:epoxyqueuosine reductase
MDTKTIIKDFLSQYGISIVGFGTMPANHEISEIEQTLPRIIVCGYILSASVLATIKDRPTLIYKHHYKTVNWILDQTACQLVRFIEDKGNRALAIPASQIVNWEKRQGHISHIILGQRAGLGYIGKSGLLIHPRFGAQVRYVSILTDLMFEPDPPVQDSCGDCDKCISACPAQAITEQGLDIKRCYEKLCEFAGIKGIGQHICGVCVKVCHGQRE